MRGNDFGALRCSAGDDPIPKPFGTGVPIHNVMGWMQGFPPPEDKIITQPDSIYFSFPRLRWSVCHLREFLPTEEISRGLGAPNPLNYVSSQDFDLAQVEIDALTFTPMNSDATMTWEESLFANYTDGMLILHKGQVVYERYFGCLEEDGKHAIMSMTKSVTGLLGEILVAEGVLDDSLLVRDIIPEIGDSAFATGHHTASHGHDDRCAILGRLFRPQRRYLAVFRSSQSIPQAG